MAEIVEHAGIDGEWEHGDEGEAFTATTSVADGRDQRVSSRLVVDKLPRCPYSPAQT